MSIASTSSGHVQRPELNFIIHRINNGGLTGIHAVMQESQCQNTDELIQYIRSGIQNTEGMRIVLPRLLQMSNTEQQHELYERIEAICREIGIMIQKERCEVDDFCRTVGDGSINEEDREAINHLLKLGYEHLLNDAKTANGIFVKWNFIKNLLLLNIIPQFKSSRPFPLNFDDTISTRIRTWFRNDMEEWRRLVLVLRADLENTSDPRIARKSAEFLQNNFNTLIPIAGNYNESDENYLSSLQWTIDYVLEKTSDNALLRSRNAYNLYQRLQTIGSAQSPQPIRFEYEGRTYLFQYPQNLKSRHYFRRDVSEDLHPNILNTIFNSISQKVSAKHDLYIEILKILGEYKDDSPYEQQIGIAREILYDLETNFINDHQINQLLDLPTDPDAEIKQESFYLYALIKFCMRQISDHNIPNQFSKTEEYLLGYAFMINGCITGKKEKICEIYRQIPVEIRNQLGVENGIDVLSQGTQSRHQRLLSLLSPLLGEISEKVEILFSRPYFINQLMGREPESDIAEMPHQSRYGRNRFMNLIVFYQCVFDMLSYYIETDLLAIDEIRFKEIFSRYSADIFRDFSEMVDRLGSHFNDELVRDEKRRSTFQSGNSNLTMDIQDLLQYTIGNGEDIFDFDDESYQILGIKKEALMAIMEILGVVRLKPLELKIASEPSLTDQQIVDLVMQDRPITSLDLRECSWITSDGLQTIIAQCPFLTAVRLKGIERLNLTINENFPELKLEECRFFTFQYEGDQDLTDDRLIALVDKIPTLTHMRIENCPLLTDESIQVISDRCDHLMEISLPSNETITKMTIDSFNQDIHVKQPHKKSYLDRLKNQASESLKNCSETSTMMSQKSRESSKSFCNIQ